MGPETKAVIRGTKMYWNPGDTLGVFPDRGSQVYFLVDSEGEAVSAPFDGGAWEFKANSVYTSYYPLVGQFYLTPDRIPVQFYKERNGRIELQTQVGNDSSAHTSDYLYMYTNPQEVEDNHISFLYHHLWTVLKPIVTLPAGHYTKLTFSLDEPLFIVKGYFDLTSDAPAIIGTEYANEVSMDLDVTFDATTELTAYYATAPLDMQGKTLTITITEESGREYTYTYNPSKAYKAGTTYKLTSSESFANNVIYYTSTDGEIVSPHATDVFGANIISNKYENGRGVLTFDGDVTSIGDWAFYDCSSLTSITISDHVNIIGDDAFGNCSSLTSITIPDGVTSIGVGAFSFCSSLIEVNIPNKVTDIGERAFRGCSSLTNVTIPERVKVIGEGAFSACPSLTSFSGKYTTSDGRSLIIRGCFIACASNGLTEFTIPEGVTRIGDLAFNFCDTLVSIVIPDSVQSIGYYAFWHCDSLVSIDIPESVISLEDSAFQGCISLLRVNIPRSIKNIGVASFYACSNLTSITINAMRPPLGGNGMLNNTNNCPIYVPAESVEAYKSAEYWSDYADRIQANAVDTPDVWLDTVDVTGDISSWNVNLSDFFFYTRGSFMSMYINLRLAERDTIYIGDDSRRGLFSKLFPSVTFMLGFIDDYGEFIESPSSGDGIYLLDISDLSCLSNLVIKYNNDRPVSESFNIFIPVEFKYVGGSFVEELVIHVICNDN